MSDQAAEQSTEAKPEVASLGAPQRVNLTNTTTVVEKEKQDEGAVAEAKVEDKVVDAPEISEDQVKAFLKSKGFENFETLDELKDKFKTPANAAEPTEEEKAKAALDKEKKQLDLFLASGEGTIEQFTAMKSVLSMDLTELSIADIRNGLKDKFAPETIEKVIKERYYQKNPEELEQGENEDEEDFEKRKAEYTQLHEFGKNKLVAKGTSLKAKAQSFFDNLDTALSQSDLQQKEFEKEEKNISSKTDEYFSTLSKNLTLELGKNADGSDIHSVQYDVDDNDIKEVQALLKDATQRNNFLFTPEGDLNVKAIAETLLENKNLKKALKVAYLEGDSRATKLFSQKFPFRNANEMIQKNNPGAVNTNAKGVPASSGAPQRVN